MEIHLAKFWFKNIGMDKGFSFALSQEITRGRADLQRLLMMLQMNSGKRLFTVINFLKYQSLQHV